jgi:hypothetical protein
MLKPLSKTLTSDDNSFDIEGMINPTFQNLGAADVVILGNKLAQDESFPMNTSGEELTGSVTITFGTGDKKLICNYFMRVKC